MRTYAEFNVLGKLLYRYLYYFSLTTFTAAFWHT